MIACWKCRICIGYKDKEYVMVILRESHAVNKNLSVMTKRPFVGPLEAVCGQWRHHFGPRNLTKIVILKMSNQYFRHYGSLKWTAVVSETHYFLFFEEHIAVICGVILIEGSRIDWCRKKLFPAAKSQSNSRSQMQKGIHHFMKSKQNWNSSINRLIVTSEEEKYEYVSFLIKNYFRYRSAIFQLLEFVNYEYAFTFDSVVMISYLYLDHFMKNWANSIFFLLPTVIKMV